MSKVLRQVDIKKLRDKWLLEQHNHDPIFWDTIFKPTLDHSHKNPGSCRAVLDYNSNQFLGKVESAWKRFGYKLHPDLLPRVLRAMATYLEQDYSNNPIHPKHAQLMIRRFSRMNKTKQGIILHESGLSLTKIAKTSVERVKQYKNQIWRKENVYQV